MPENDSSTPVWKAPRTRYHYLAAREHEARWRGFVAGVRAAADCLRGKAAECFLEGEDREANRLRELATEVPPAISTPERPPAGVLDDAFRVLLADDTPATIPRPNVICLCGSTKFKQEFIEQNFKLTMAGHIVLTVGWFGHADAERYSPSETEKEALDELHKRKIDLADEVFIVNPGGYIGDSTRSEIEYAELLERPISYLVDPDHDAS